MRSILENGEWGEKSRKVYKHDKERWTIKGFSRKIYERKHISDLESYNFFRQELKDIIKEPDGKITPKKWRKELDKLNEECPKAKSTYSRSVYRLAGIEVLRHNRIALIQMLENESRQRQRTVEQSRSQVQVSKKKNDRGMSL
ncbi:hypothetical protein JCM13267_11410 [Howardella ureilytica]